jgi:hypothetical protein
MMSMLNNIYLIYLNIPYSIVHSIGNDRGHFSLYSPKTD